MGDILKISDAAALALHTVTMLADGGKEKSLSTKEIAAKLKASEAHLSKVLQRLAKAGLVSSIRGPKGGFRLEKDAKDITLLDVYEAIDGRLSVTRCLFGEPVCGQRGCILGNAMEEASGMIRARMAGTRLADLAADRGRLSGSGSPKGEVS